MQTINDIRVTAEVAEEYFTTKLGYTRAKFSFGAVYKDKITLFFDLYDDFQEKLPSEMRYKTGGANTVQVDDHHEFWAKLQNWPNREQRELHIMARKAAAIDADLEFIQSAQVRAFVESLRPSLEELRRQIGHESTTEIE